MQVIAVAHQQQYSMVGALVVVVAVAV